MAAPVAAPVNALWPGVSQPVKVKAVNNVRDTKGTRFFMREWTYSPIRT
jgi:hypothetical protein